MPRLSAWAVRLSLLYLLLGFTVGAIMLANKGIPFAPWIWRLLPAHIDFLLFGFVIQLAIGIAHWILPRYQGGSRGKETLVWGAISLLNLGIWTVSCISLFNLPGQWLVVGRLLEGTAAVLFASQAWGRIRPS
ncbi:MAG: hypothetical protein IT308_06185 [Anaerolineaceae bacterium]|nr:hypothetical protein [Anaerolineaceae bacterium]